MKNYKHILEAINRGIKLALDDYEDMENNEPISSKHDIIKNEHIIKKYKDFYDLFIDLGLPSGTLWCKYNLGCDFELLNSDSERTDPKDWYGNYYAWGELNPKKDYSLKTYKFNNLIKYNKEDKLSELLLEDDAAYQFDNRMKMPTRKQFEELLKYTTNKWVKNYLKIKGLNGRLFTSTINGNQLFIPASGYYFDESLYNVGSYCRLWSSSLNLGYSDLAYYLGFNSDYINIYGDNRCDGFAVRPVLY